MPTSGTYDYELENFQLLDEVFERAGLDPAAITARHIASAKRSAIFLFSDWSTRGIAQFRIERVNHTVTAGENSFDLDPQYIHVVEAYLRRDNVSTPMARIPRDTYESITDKAIEGRPSQFFTDLRRGNVTVRYWLAAENSTDVIELDCVRMHESLGSMRDQPDVAYRYLEALAAGLAARVSQKYSADRYMVLKDEADMSFQRARLSDDDGGDLHIQPVYHGRWWGRQR